MLAAYLIALAVGGVMLTLSMVGGDGDHGGNGGHGGSGGHGSSGHDSVGGGHGGAIDLVLGWLPITSLRFWIVFAAFFGLTGTALSLGGFAGPEPVPALLAGAVGWVAGVTVVAAIRKLGTSEVSSSVGERDLVGATALVLVPIAKGSPGKVRVRMKDRAVDLTATCDDEDALAEGAEVVIYAVEADGHVVVTRGDAAAGGSSEGSPAA